MNQQKKIRIIISTLILMVGIVSSLFASTLLHGFLSGEITSLTIPRIRESIDSLIASSEHLKLFLCFLVLTILASVGFYFSNDKTYQSRLVKVTDEIYTPAVAGQNQHGSARWLTEDEKEKIFKSYNLNKNDRTIEEIVNVNKEET